MGYWGASGRAALSLALFSPGARGLNPASAASVRGGARFLRARGGEPLALHSLLVESRFSLHTRGLCNFSLNLALQQDATVVPWCLSGNRPAWKTQGPTVGKRWALRSREGSCFEQAPPVYPGSSSGVGCATRREE